MLGLETIDHFLPFQDSMSVAFAELGVEEPAASQNVELTHEIDSRMLLVPLGPDWRRSTR